MTDFTILTPSEQEATHLRGELFRGRWTGTMPGRDRLAEELGMNRKTIVTTCPIGRKLPRACDSVSTPFSRRLLPTP